MGNYCHFFFNRLPACTGMLFILLCTSLAYAQSAIPIQEKKDPKIINVKHASRLVYDNSLGIDIQHLAGTVVCEHYKVTLHCDSAIIYPQEMVAIGHISLTKGDNILIYADSMKYNINTKLAHLNGNIQCIEKGKTLKANFLVYDSENEKIITYK